MRIILKVAVTALLVCTLFPAAAANAQTDCARADYCNPDTPENGGSDDGGGSDTDGTASDTDDLQRGESGGATTGESGGVNTGESGGASTGGGGNDVLGAESEAGAAAETAPSGSLPITGGDVVGIAALGAAAVGLGAVLVKRSKAAKQPA